MDSKKKNAVVAEGGSDEPPEKLPGFDFDVTKPQLATSKTDSDPNNRSSVRADGQSAELRALAETFCGMASALGATRGTLSTYASDLPVDPAEVEQRQLEEEKVFKLTRDVSLVTAHARYWLDPNLPPSDEEQRARLFKSGEAWFARLFKVPGQPLLKVGRAAYTESKKNMYWVVGFNTQTSELWLRLKSHSHPYHLDISGANSSDIDKLAKLQFRLELVEGRQEKKLMELRESVFHPERVSEKQKKARYLGSKKAADSEAKHKTPRNRGKDVHEEPRRSKRKACANVAKSDEGADDGDNGTDNGDGISNKLGQGDGADKKGKKAKKSAPKQTREKAKSSRKGNSRAGGKRVSAPKRKQVIASSETSSETKVEQPIAETFKQPMDADLVTSQPSRRSGGKLRVTQAYAFVSHALETASTLQALQNENNSLRAQNTLLQTKLRCLESMNQAADE